jgi:CRISPR-associated endonuclease Csn1
MPEGYRLGLDVGTNSLGWCLLRLDAAGQPDGIIDMGVRVFSDGRDPQDKSSLAVNRRIARSMRRRRDRFLARRHGLLNALVRHGLMPSDPVQRKTLERLDPYELRARGLDESLAPHEFGRAIFHLNQRRGFKSNRKTDGGDSESGKIRSAIVKVRQDMNKQGARTFGEFLWQRGQNGDGVRARLIGQGAKAEYDLYPDRALAGEEFDALWHAQALYHPGLLTAEARRDLERILFFQRPLKPVPAGKCTFIPSEERAPRALPLAQEFRILQELANLRIDAIGEPSRVLTKDERDALASELMKKEKLTFDQMRRKLKLEATTRFSLESQKRNHLDGNKTAQRLARKGFFGAAWHDLDQQTQTEIAERLLGEQDEEKLIEWLSSEFGLDDETARKVSGLALPEGHAAIGRTALAKIVPILRRDVIGYHEAVKEVGWHHSDFRDGEIYPKLPYYAVRLDRHVAFGSGNPADPQEKRVGRIANPTVHVAMNQIRRVVNAAIERYGHPSEIAVEVARELPAGAKRLSEIEREQTDNQRANDQRRARLTELGLPDNGENRLRLRLWEELNPGDPIDRRCVYTGEQISIERLFSNEVEIEHILPFSRTLDNGFTNKTVSMRWANRLKTQQTPHEAFQTRDGFDWEAVLARAASLPENKRWRFNPDAMERFESERDFLARQLVDTQYIARLSREYLTAVCDPNKVWVTPGRLTQMLRGRWGLNSLLPDHNFAPTGQPKNRTDHRHHAIDAFVIGVTDRAMLQRVATAAARTEESNPERLVDDMPEPWTGFRDELKALVDTTVVSVKPDHGIQGRLHEDTAYGLVADPDAEEGFTVVYRKNFLDLNENEVKRIRDIQLRQSVLDGLAEAKQNGVSHKDAIAQLAKPVAEGGIEKHGLRRVRLLKREDDLIPIADDDGRIYKAYSPGDNHRIEIFALPDGTWKGEAVTVFDANRKDHVSAWRERYPGARLVMAVHKGDLLCLEHEGGERIMRVFRLSISNNVLYLADHQEAGSLQKRHNDGDDPFRWLFANIGGLRDRKARRVRVDELGRVYDHGFVE